MSHQTACAFFTSTNILTNQIKSCPNLERLSLQNIRLNDAVTKLVPQLLIKLALLRTWLTSWPSRDCGNSEKSTYLPLEPQSWTIINDMEFNAICWQCCWPCWALSFCRIYWYNDNHDNQQCSVHRASCNVYLAPCTFHHTPCLCTAWLRSLSFGWSQPAQAFRRWELDYEIFKTVNSIWIFWDAGW